jgi:uncharacterized protein YkwD
MKNRRFTIITLALLLLCSAAATSAQTTYWLGTRDGGQLKFTTQIPADAAAIIMYSAPAKGRGADTSPRYRNFTYNIDGRSIRFHANELGWETPDLDQGSLTWAVAAGVGAEWKSADPKNPLWGGFAAGLRSLAKDTEGWSYAKVIMAEGNGNSGPSARLNLDGTYGAMSPDKIAEQKLIDLSSNDSLSDDELDQVRGFLLAIANAARANTNYRRDAGAKSALNIPAGLTPLQLDDKLNQAAQVQAEYCARIKETTHDNADPDQADMGKRLKNVGYEEMGYEAAGQGSLLNACPECWMKSETHYRPWWNFDNQVVTKIGYGVAKADNGIWYFVAVLGQ